MLAYVSHIVPLYTVKSTFVDYKAVNQIKDCTTLCKINHNFFLIFLHEISNAQTHKNICF